MSKFIPLLLIVLCLSSCKSNPEKKSEQFSEKGKEEFQNLANAFSETWNKHDPKALTDFWAEDGDLLSLWSDVYTGKSAIEKHFVEEQSNEMKDAQINFVVQNVRLIDPETAFVDTDFTIKGMKVDGENAVPLHDHAVFLFVKINDKWQILIARPY